MRLDVSVFALLQSNLDAPLGIGARALRAALPPPNRRATPIAERHAAPAGVPADSSDHANAVRRPPYLLRPGAPDRLDQFPRELKIKYAQWSPSAGAPRACGHRDRSRVPRRRRCEIKRHWESTRVCTSRGVRTYAVHAIFGVMIGYFDDPARESRLRKTRI
jgi:hypothetical protein